MKWTKIKNIMVCFLIVMNLFMLATIAFTTAKRSYLPQEAIHAAKSVLKEAGFNIPSAVFPEKYETLPVYSAEFFSASDLSDLLFCKQIPFRTVENSLVATEGYATLTVSDNYFSYDSGYDAAENQSTSALKRALDKKGFDISQTVYDKKSGCFYKIIKGKKLFNIFLEVKLDDDGEICFIKAQWPKKIIAGERKKISFIESALKIKDVFPEGGEIQEIELGYSLRSVGGEKFSLIPSWRVKLNNEYKIL